MSRFGTQRSDSGRNGSSTITLERLNLGVTNGNVVVQLDFRSIRLFRERDFGSSNGFKVPFKLLDVNVRGSWTCRRRNEGDSESPRA
jgi:hypothetical protein